MSNELYDDLLASLNQALVIAQKKIISWNFGQERADTYFSLK